MGRQNKTKRKELERAFRRQKGKCHLCGKQMSQSLSKDDEMRATADHVVPKSHGGNINGNIMAAHAVCNHRRGNRSIDDFKKLYEE